MGAGLAVIAMKFHIGVLEKEDYKKVALKFE